MTTLTKNVNGNTIVIDYNPSQLNPNQINSLTINGVPLFDRLPDGYFQYDVFDIQLDPQAVAICNIIFDLIKKIKLDQQDELLAVHLADYLFGRFLYIANSLNNRKYFIPALRLWYKIFNIVWCWENENGSSIHKGTPYYGIAFSLYVLGDIATSYLYVSNAVEEDKIAYSHTSMPDKYRDSPAYKLATIVDDPNNMLYDLVKELKNRLTSFIDNYNSYLGKRFTYAELESKFLRNNSFEQLVFYFVYRLSYLIRWERAHPKAVQNEFTQLHNLDLIFDFCLIVDKVLQARFGGKMIGENIFELWNARNWLASTHINSKEKSKTIKDSIKPYVDLDGDPDDKVHKLLNQNCMYNGSHISKEMSVTLLVWYLRNYGGHNIKAQKILVDSFDDIIKFLMYALFMAIEVLP
jgi:hypothetical protein